MLVRSCDVAFGDVIFGTLCTFSSFSYIYAVICICCFFSSGKGSDVPPIYAVDSTNEEDWEKNVQLPSSEVIASFLQVFATVSHEISIFSLIIFPLRLVLKSLVASRCNIGDATKIPSCRWALQLFETVQSIIDPPCGAGAPLFPLVHLLPHLFPFLLFPFFRWLYLFSSFVHPFPFYQNSPTPFPGWRS